MRLETEQDELSPYLNLMPNPSRTLDLVARLRELAGKEPAREVHLGIGGDLTSPVLLGHIVLSKGFAGESDLRDFLGRDGLPVPDGSIIGEVYSPPEVSGSIRITTSRRTYGAHIGGKLVQVQIPKDYRVAIESRHLLNEPEFRVTEMHFKVNPIKYFSSGDLQSYLGGLKSPLEWHGDDYYERDSVIDGFPVMEGLHCLDSNPGGSRERVIVVTISPLDSRLTGYGLPRNFDGMPDALRYSLMKQWESDLGGFYRGMRDPPALVTLKDVKL